MRARRLCRLGLLTAIALTIFLLEAQLPPLAPVPGFKLGLSHVVIMFTTFALGPWDALGVLMCRVFLGSVFSGQMMSLLYAAAGGLVAWGITLLFRSFLKEHQRWVCGPFSAMGHSLGQMTVAVLVTGTPQLWGYLPWMLIFSLITGTFTGLCAQLTLKYTKKLFPGRTAP